MYFLRLVTSPLARSGCVRSDDQGLEAQGPRRLDQLFVQLPVRLHVELEPPQASGGRSDEVFEGTAGVGAGDVADAGCLGGCAANGVTQAGGQGSRDGGEIDARGVGLASGQPALGVQAELDALPFPCGAGIEGSDLTGRPGAVCVALRTTCPMNPAGRVLPLVPHLR